jgi:FtsH-binding integral membrane protein
MSNFPDRPKQPWISASAADTSTQVQSFIRSVYAWMFGGLLLTAASAWWVVNSAAMQQVIFGNRAMPWVLMLAELGLVMYLSFRITKMAPGAAASIFLVFALLNGLTLSSIFFVYRMPDIFLAFVTSAGMFGAMSVYGMVTKRDLTSWGSFFFMGLIGIIICSVINIFLKSSALGFAISFIGVFVFLGLTAYDTQKLKAYATAPELRENLAVYGALALYLDFINLFLMLLRLFGGNSRR